MLNAAGLAAPLLWRCGDRGGSHPASAAFTFGFGSVGTGGGWVWAAHVPTWGRGPTQGHVVTLWAELGRGQGSRQAWANSKKAIWHGQPHGPRHFENLLGLTPWYLGVSGGGLGVPPGQGDQSQSEGRLGET